MLKEFSIYMQKYKYSAILSVICVILETVFELFIPFVMADIIDIGVANNDRDYIITKGIQMCILALFSLFLGILYARFAAICGQGFGSELRKAEYKKIQQFSFSNMDHFSTASLVTRLTSDITTIQNSISTGIRPLVRSPFMMLMGLLFSFSLNAKLTFVFFIASPILAICLYQIIQHVRPMYRKMQQAIDLVNRMVQENLIAIRVVKAYVRGDYETAKFSSANIQLQTASERAFRIASLNMPAMQFVMYGTIIAILWFGGNLIFMNRMKVGELTGFLSYVLQILNSLMMISNVFMQLTRSMTSGARILEVMKEEIEITEKAKENLTITNGEIRFEHVSFKYKKEALEYALYDVSFHIKSGQTIGIIGGTGSSKTTLIQLIPRLYEATKGNVFIDGFLVSHYSLAHLRETIAVVLQKNTLFSGTILENLRWGKESATKEEIETACKIACADEFIKSFPDQYETILGQGGVNLSGGQKQRLCIARALLRNPKILILDDSTSAVDTATETSIREGLTKYLPNTTKIIIAQRISSISYADQIIVMDDGKINEIGTHNTLLKTNAIYQEVYYSQQEGVGL